MIFTAIETPTPPEFIGRFLRSTNHDSITHVEFAGTTRGQLQMARGVRQGCPASGFLFAMAFDLIFRWHQEAVIPRNPHNLDFLQPAQCACADDLAVAAPSFLRLMTALAPPFQSVDHVAGPNLNHRKCCWVQYATEERESLCCCYRPLCKCCYRCFCEQYVEIIFLSLLCHVRISNIFIPLIEDIGGAEKFSRSCSTHR